MSKPWSVWKDVAYPGRVVVPGEGGPLAYDFTARDMEQLERTGNAKVRDGWNVPVCYEHQDVAPERVRMSANPDRDFARGVFGRIERFARTPDGRLKALLAGSDPADFERLRKIGFVSPEIQWDWTDTDGKTWHGPTVTHLAATPRPVQRHQHPVGTDPDTPHPRLTPVNSLETLVRMSLGHPAGRPPGVGRRLCLSLDHYTAAPGGSSAMADEPTIPGAGPEKKKSPWERIADALAAAGVKIGTGENVKDADHLADLIEVASLNSAANQDTDPDLPEETDEDPEAPAGDMDAPPEGATEPPPPVQMSQLAGQKLIDLHRGRLVERAERLGVKGHVPPAVANEMVARLKRVKLSLTASADLAPTAVTAVLDAYEKLPAGKAWTDKQPRPGDKPKPGKKPAARLSLPANTGEADASPYQESADPADDAAVVESYEAMVGRGN